MILRMLDLKFFNCCINSNHYRYLLPVDLFNIFPSLACIQLATWYSRRKSLYRRMLFTTSRGDPRCWFWIITRRQVISRWQIICPLAISIPADKSSSLATLTNYWQPWHHPGESKLWSQCPFPLSINNHPLQYLAKTYGNPAQISGNPEQISGNPDVILTGWNSDP